MAETLITLTIIGIIAALTVPSLISEYRKHSYVVGLKKAYSQLQNAVKMIPITEGCSAGDYECTGLLQGITGKWGLGEWVHDNPVTNIDGQDFGGNAGKKHAYLFSKQFKTSWFGNITSSLGFNFADGSYPSVFEYGFITQDGITYAFNNASIGIDINGRKGPNKTGRDIFYLEIAGTDQNGISKGTIIPFGSKLQATYYGNEDYSYWKNNKFCTTQKANDSTWVNWEKGRYCTGRVLEEDAMNY